MAPKKPMKICYLPSCGRKTHNTYCDQHKHMKSSGWKKKKKAHPWYQHKVWCGSKNKPFGQRGGLRESKLMQTPYCEQCKKVGIIRDVTGKGAGIVDHRKPFQSAETEAEQWALFTDSDNLQSLCKSCHAEKTGRGE